MEYPIIEAQDSGERKNEVDVQKYAFSGLLVRAPICSYTKENVMSVCGWNDTMAAGLKLFAEGLAIQTKKRALEEGVGVEKVPAIEIAELKALLDAISFSEKGRKELEGIFSDDACAFSLSTDGQRAKSEASAEVLLVRASGEVSALFSEMEEHNVRELKPKYPYREAMWRLARFLEDRV